MKFLLMLALTFGAGSLVLLVVRASGWPYWSYHLLVVSIGLGLYFVSNYLTVNFVRKRAPGFASKEEVVPGVQAWELTAGTGIVPRWVSFIGLLAIAFVLASPFELFAWLLRAVQK